MKSLLRIEYLFSLLLFLFSVSDVFSEDSAVLANRRTALRCLATATNYISEKNWDGAISQAHLGIAYDDSVSDLWYVCAVSESALGKNKAYILPFLEKALGDNNWVNYNRDNARLMYSDILCETGRMSEALAVLDSEPLLYSSDAEFIRVKAYYRLKDAESVSKARNKIDGARRIYSSDIRFPLVFFKNESPDDTSQTVRRLASYFISQLERYTESPSDAAAELKIHAARFSEGEEKVRLLEAFSAEEFRHPLYASEALKAGLLNEEQAFDYISSFADEKEDYDVFKEFILLLNDENTLLYAADYLKSFDGTFFLDTDKDGNENLLVKFSRGRPDWILFDSNQDGDSDWMIQCDFGLPVSGSLGRLKMNFQWTHFPFLAGAEFIQDGSGVSERFSFVPETLRWAPLRVERDAAVSDKLGFDFFFPVINTEEADPTVTKLLDSASDFEISFPGAEKIRFVLLDGNIQQALYYDAEGRLYAQAQFEGNVPVLRVVDSDSDGIFETTEFYAIDSEGKMNVHSLQDERKVMQNLFGLPSDNAEFYLRMVQIDTDGDTVPDFTEEYLENNGKISSWDTDGDGNWNVRHVVYPDGISEDSMFYAVPENVLVIVRTENGVPVRVTNGDEVLSVHADSENGFYWLLKSDADFDKDVYSALAKEAKAALNAEDMQGFSMVIEGADENVLCIRIGGFDFGILTENGNKDE